MWLPPAKAALPRYQESRMPNFTANGHVKVGPAGKRHGMIKRTTKFVRKARGTMVLSAPDEGIVKVYMPYNR